MKQKVKGGKAEKYQTRNKLRSNFIVSILTSTFPELVFEEQEGNPSFGWVR
jgi:hypothetical protein